MFSVFFCERHFFPIVVPIRAIIKDCKPQCWLVLQLSMLDETLLDSCCYNLLTKQQVVMGLKAEATGD